MTLKEIKSDLRITICELKEVVDRMSETEECGVDKYSGHYGQTSGYSTLVDYKARLETMQDIYKLLVKVRRLK